MLEGLRERGERKKQRQEELALSLSQLEEKQRERGRERERERETERDEYDDVIIPCKRKASELEERVKLREKFFESDRKSGGPEVRERMRRLDRLLSLVTRIRCHFVQSNRRAMSLAALLTEMGKWNKTDEGAVEHKKQIELLLEIVPHFCQLTTGNKPIFKLDKSVDLKKVKKQLEEYIKRERETLEEKGLSTVGTADV